MLTLLFLTINLLLRRRTESGNDEDFNEDDEDRNSEDGADNLKNQLSINQKPENTNGKL